MVDWQRQQIFFFGKYNVDEKLYLSEKKIFMFRLPIYFVSIKWEKIKSKKIVNLKTNWLHLRITIVILAEN